LLKKSIEICETLQHHQDERTIASTYLTFYNPENTLFYKYSQNYSLLNEKKLKKNENSHYLQLINRLDGRRHSA
jgi:hypothetical protein